MEDIIVGRLMSSPVHTISVEATVQDAARIPRSEEIGSIVVVDDDNHPQGILTTTDIARLTANGRNPSTMEVATVMSSNVITTTVHDQIRDMADMMIEHSFHHVPVVDDSDGVIGIITTLDLTAYLSYLESPTPAE